MESEMGSIVSAGIGGRVNGVGAKRRKSSSSSSQGGEVCTTIDRISDLPESIILHILSLIPTKDTFKTSLLSKRWKLYWTKVSKFDFEERYWPEKLNRHINFVEFVNMVLANQTYEYIHDLKLWWSSSKLNPSSFVATAISRNVRRLDLGCVDGNGSRLPDALYTCTTLEYLSLVGPFIVSVSGCVVCLPKLSTLMLYNVVAESNESLPKILSGCPVLHTLCILKQQLYECVLGSTISSASLKSLLVQFSEKPGWIGNRDITLEIDAPALRTLHIADKLSGKISVRGGMNQLDSGWLDVPCLLLGREDMFARLVEVFRGVKILAVTDETMRAMAISKPLLLSFERLITLKIIFRSPGWPSPVDLIDSCFNIQYLYIMSRFQKEYSAVPDVYNLVRIPRCMLSSLRFVAFLNFGQLGEEMALLKFILLHGRVLDTVYLWYKNYKPSDSEGRRNILDQVSRLPKASPSCKILEWNPRLVLDWVGFY